MHETGAVKRLLADARARAEDQGARLIGVAVRLGALAGEDEAHFRETFEHVAGQQGMTEVTLAVEMAPDRPAGIELVSIEVAG